MPPAGRASHSVRAMVPRRDVHRVMDDLYDLGARGILVNQLDRELDTAQKRQQGPGQSDALGLTNPGTRVNTVRGIVLSDGSGLAFTLSDSSTENKPPEATILPTAVQEQLFAVPADGAKHTVRLGDLLPLVAMAQRMNFIWLKDFLDDEVVVSHDLYEVMQAFRSSKPTSA